MKKITLTTGIIAITSSIFITMSCNSSSASISKIEIKLDDLKTKDDFVKLTSSKASKFIPSPTKINEIAKNPPTTQEGVKKSLQDIIIFVQKVTKIKLEYSFIYKGENEKAILDFSKLSEIDTNINTSADQTYLLQKIMQIGTEFQNMSKKINDFFDENFKKTYIQWKKDNNFTLSIKK